MCPFSPFGLYVDLLYIPESCFFSFQLKEAILSLLRDFKNELCKIFDAVLTILAVQSSR